MKKQPDIYYDKASGYTKAIIYYKNNTFIGEAQCHPEDEDIISEFTGSEIALRRANIKVMQFVKNNEIVPQISILKHLKSLQDQHEETLLEKSYEITLKKLLQLENDLATLKEMIALEKQELKLYIDAQEKFAAVIRAKKEKAQKD